MIAKKDNLSWVIILAIILAVIVILFAIRTIISFNRNSSFAPINEYNSISDKTSEESMNDDSCVDPSKSVIVCPGDLYCIQEQGRGYKYYLGPCVGVGKDRQTKSFPSGELTYAEGIVRMALDSQVPACEQNCVSLGTYPSSEIILRSCWKITIVRECVPE